MNPFFYFFSRYTIINLKRNSPGLPLILIPTPSDNRMDNRLGDLLAVNLCTAHGGVTHALSVKRSAYDRSGSSSRIERLVLGYEIQMAYAGTHSPGPSRWKKPLAQAQGAQTKARTRPHRRPAAPRRTPRGRESLLYTRARTRPAFRALRKRPLSAHVLTISIIRCGYRQVIVIQWQCAHIL